MNFDMSVEYDSGRDVVCQVVVDVRLIRELAAMAAMENKEHNKLIGSEMRGHLGFTEAQYPNPGYSNFVKYSVLGILEEYGLDINTCLPKDTESTNVKTNPLPALMYNPKAR